MADAYDIMQMAKRSGAQVQQQEDWQNYQDELAASEAKRSKGGFWSGLASMGLMKILPKLIPGMGAASTIMDLLMTGVGRGAIGFGLGEGIRSLTGADTKAPEFKGTSTGPYGRKGFKEMQRKSELISKSIADEIKGGKRGRAFSQFGSSFLTDKDLWSAKGDKLGDLFGDIGKGSVTTGTPFVAGPDELIGGVKPSFGAELTPVSYTEPLINRLIAGGGDILGTIGQGVKQSIPTSVPTGGVKLLDRFMEMLKAGGR